MNEWKKGTCHTFCLKIEFGNSRVSDTVELMAEYSVLPVSKDVQSPVLRHISLYLSPPERRDHTIHNNA
jgi:hypothetical protein